MKKILAVLALLLALAMPAAAQRIDIDLEIERMELENRLRRIERQMFEDRLRRDYGSKIDGSLDRYQEQLQRDGRLASPYEAPCYDLYQPARGRRH
jgi:hypothetical protein